MSVRAPMAREDEEQSALFEWAEIQKGKYPELALMYHIPNEGKRTPRTGARMRAMGLRRGVPDVHLPVARGGMHGLYIELKRRDGGVLTEEQAAWLDRLREQGHCVAVCRGWERAARVIVDYLCGEMEA